MAKRVKRTVIFPHKVSLEKVQVLSWNLINCGTFSNFFVPSLTWLFAPVHSQQHFVHFAKGNEIKTKKRQGWHSVAKSSKNGKLNRNLCLPICQRFGRKASRKVSDLETVAPCPKNYYLFVFLLFRHLCCALGNVFNRFIKRRNAQTWAFKIPREFRPNPSFGVLENFQLRTSASVTIRSWGEFSRFEAQQQRHAQHSHLIKCIRQQHKSMAVCWKDFPSTPICKNFHSPPSATQNAPNDVTACK